MRRISCSLIGVMSLALLTGCMGGYEGPGLHEPIDPKVFFEAPPADFDYGEPPSAGIIERATQEYFKFRLKDPQSAEYRYGQPQRSYKAKTALTQIDSYTPDALQFTMFAIKNGENVSGKLQWVGWSVPIAVNAKNSFGGYTGFEGHVLMFMGERVIGAMSIDTWQEHIDKGIVKVLPQ